MKSQSNDTSPFNAETTVLKNANIIVTPIQIKGHNKKLSNILLEKINIEYPFIFTRDTMHQQLRYFYVLIIVGLFSILLIPRFAEETLNSKNCILNLIIIVIIFMHLLDIHILNMDSRFNARAGVYFNSYKELENSFDTKRWF